MNVFNFLSGYKTYLMALAMIIYGYHVSDTKLVMEGLGFLFMRMGIAKLGE